LQGRQQETLRSLIMVDVLQRVTVGKESTASAVTWGAGQIRDAIKA